MKISGARSPVVWRRRMPTSAAPTLRACWALEQVNSLISDVNFDQQSLKTWTNLCISRWCECLCHRTRLADCRREVAVQGRWRWEWRTRGEQSWQHFESWISSRLLYTFLCPGPKRPAGKHGNYLCSRDGADSVVFTPQQGKELLN